MRKVTVTVGARVRVSFRRILNGFHDQVQVKAWGLAGLIVTLTLTLTLTLALALALTLPRTLTLG